MNVTTVGKYWCSQQASSIQRLQTHSEKEKIVCVCVCVFVNKDALQDP